MKVALYYPWVYLTSGAERAILELMRHSRHRWTVFTNRFERERTFPGFAECDVVELPRVSVVRSLGAVAGAAWRLALQKLPLDGFDALLVVCEGLGDLVVFRNSGRPILCLCLTPLRLSFDPFYRRRALAERGLLGRLLVDAGSRAFRWIDRRAWRRYAHVFSISEEVKGRILRGRLLEDPSMLEVVHVGIGVRPENPTDCWQPYFLLPGRVMWTKCLELGIEAFRRFRRLRPDLDAFRLVIAGMVDRKSEAYLRRLRALAEGIPEVEFRLSPPDPEMAGLYERCHAVLFTAFNEDWGIVPLEGMAFGKPVIAVDRGGPRESLVHGVQGFLEDPDPEAFARRMVELAADPGLARALGRAGRERARGFTWTRFAEPIDRQIDRLCS